SREKGSVDLLEAAARAWAEGGRFRLVLAGPEMSNFVRFWEGYGARGKVRRFGGVDDRQKRGLFPWVERFPLAGRVAPFGIVLLEAWANGAPNVGYRAGGIPWVIRDGKDGLLVRCGDLGGLAAALRRLAADAGLRRRLGEAGRERTRHEFCWEDKLRLVRDLF